MKDPKEIIKQVEEVYFIPRGSIMKCMRGKILSEARHVAMYLCKIRTRFSIVELAQIFKVDHSSISYAIRRIKNTKDRDIIEMINRADDYKGL